MLGVFHSQVLRTQRPTMQVHHLHTTKNLLEHSEASLRSLSQHIKKSFTFTPRIGSSREPAARDGVCGALLSDIRLPNSKKQRPTNTRLDETTNRRKHETTQTRTDVICPPPTPPTPLNDCWNPVCFKNVQIHGGPYGRDTKNNRPWSYKVLSNKSSQGQIADRNALPWVVQMLLLGEMQWGGNRSAGGVLSLIDPR